MANTPKLPESPTAPESKTAMTVFQRTPEADPSRNPILTVNAGGVPLAVDPDRVIDAIMKGVRSAAGRLAYRQMCEHAGYGDPDNRG